MSNLNTVIGIGKDLSAAGKARLKLSLRLHDEDMGEEPPIVDVFAVTLPRDERSEVVEKEKMEDSYAGQLSPANTATNPMLHDVKAQEILKGFANRLRGKRAEKAKVLIIAVPTEEDEERYEVFRKPIPVVKGKTYPITICMTPKLKSDRQQDDQGDSSP